MIQAGRLRKRITLQTATESRGSDGAAILTWVDTKTIYAEVIPYSASESEEGEKVYHDVTHLITIRYYSALTTSKQRFKWGTRILNITSIVNVKEMGVFMEVGCIEEK